MKRRSLLALILVLVISLTGCFGGETKLYNAFNKMQDITSMESEMELGFTFEGEGFSPEEEMAIQAVATMLNTTKYNLYQKTVQNKEKTAATVESILDMDLGGLKLPIKLWVDTDMSEDQFKMVEVFELPPMLTGLAFPQMGNKQYLVYDIDEVMGMTEDLDMKEVMELSKELQPKIMEFIKEIEKDFKPEIDMVKKMDSKEIDGEKLSIYEVKLDDESLKELVKYTVDYILENEAFAGLITEYMDNVVKMALDQETLSEEEAKEIAGEMKELEKALPELKEKFHGFMEEYGDIKILGDKGITIEFGINKKGYIVHEAGNIDLRLDLSEIAKAMGEEIPGEAKVINLGINYKSKVYNINNKDVRVNMPETNEENSIKLTELMEMFVEQLNTMENMAMPLPEATPLP